ncbi:hypothetical protein SRB17_90230 [Streptomyces sp. RB17]|nr:hypothetical protein [Streptomyces sp. RB17]
MLDDIQSAPVEKPDVEDTWITVPAEVGDVRVRIVKPVGAAAGLPVILYVHGGGWIMLNPLRPTQAATAAIEQAVHTLRKALGHSS